MLADAIAECLGGPALGIVRQLLPFVHPCELLPMYGVGQDTGEAVGHRVAALAPPPVGDPSRVLEQLGIP